MHPSAQRHMKHCIDTYLDKGRHYRVVDLGSRISDGQVATHRDLLAGYDCSIVGVDVRPGRNVDALMTKPYRIPLKSGSADVIISGQAFEHIPFFWVSMCEMARVLRPGGLIFLTAPSRGHVHDVNDFWRFYPDSMRALAAFSRLTLLEGHTDLPPTREGTRRFAYGRIDATNAYWGDTVGVFRKPRRYSKLIAGPREVMVWWANRVGGIAGVPAPKGRAGRTPAAGDQVAQAARRGYITHGEFGVKIAYSDVIPEATVGSIAAGGYERAEASRSLALVADGDRVVELGSGLGFMSALLLSRRQLDDYQMVEADPRLAAVIARTHELNGLTDQATMNSCVATCDPALLAAGSVEFHVDSKFCASSLLGAKNLEQSVSVPTVSLPDLIREHRSNVLIMDIEGAEDGVLNGTPLDGIDKIVMEIHPHRLGQAGIARVFRNLDALGFVYYAKQSGGLVLAFTRLREPAELAETAQPATQATG